MEKSIFFKSIGAKPAIPVSYLLLETMALASEANPDKNVEIVIVMALLKLGYKEDEVPGQELKRMCDRIAEIKEEEDKASEEIPPGKRGVKSTKKTFGQDYISHMTAMSMADKCVVACNYDFDSARKLYCDVDKSITDKVVSLFFENKWQELKTGFEACVFGFGGSMDGESAPGNEFDMTSKEGLDNAIGAMKAMRF